MKYLSLQLLVFTLLFITSCGGPENGDKRSELKSNIQALEDSIAELQKDPMKAAKIPSLTNIELINRLEAYYRAFPTDSFAAECLFKIHMKYSDLRAYEKSAAYGDTLLQKFPKFANRDFLLESLASTYDLLIEPRNPDKAAFYYKLLLKEKIQASRKKDIEERLNHMDMDFFEYSTFKMNQH